MRLLIGDRIPTIQWVLLIFLLGRCNRQDENLILIDGSSTVYPITETVADEFLKLHLSLSVAIGVSGSGSGMAKLLGSETNIADASRPTTPGELATATKTGMNLIELPVAYDGQSVIAHPSNTWVDKLTVAALKKYGNHPHREN